MRKVIVTMTLLATISTALIAMAAPVREAKTADDQIAANYGLCLELKVRDSNAEEEFIIERGCPQVIVLHELKIVKEALLRRIEAIDAGSQSVQKKFKFEKEGLLARIKAIDTESAAAWNVLDRIGNKIY